MKMYSEKIAAVDLLAVIFYFGYLSPEVTIEFWKELRGYCLLIHGEDVKLLGRGALQVSLIHNVVDIQYFPTSCVAADTKWLDVDKATNIASEVGSWGSSHTCLLRRSRVRDTIVHVSLCPHSLALALALSKSLSLSGSLSLSLASLSLSLSLRPTAHASLALSRRKCGVRKGIGFPSS